MQCGWMIGCGVILAAAFISSSTANAAEVLRAGIIGCDTSHVIGFTKSINNPQATGPLAQVQVVAAYPGGSDDIASSRDRVAGFTAQLKEMGVEIVPSIDELLTKVDVVMLESVDGRPHLEQARAVIEAGKPLFIDKPLAGSLADAVKIFQLAEAKQVPCFSSSSLRFSPGVQRMRNNEKLGDVLGCAAFGPGHLEPHHPDLYWYGIHGVEILYTLMGPGCESVTRAKTDGVDLVVGVWKDGRVGTFRGIRAGKQDYGALVYGSKGIERSGGYEGHEDLMREMCQFFLTGKPPVSAAETLEIYTFMEAADASHRAGGAPVKMADVLRQARGPEK